MKNYQHWSTEVLVSRKDRILDDIKQWERIMINTSSSLIRLSLAYYVKKAKEEIRAIDAELCYRMVNKEKDATVAE